MTLKTQIFRKKSDISCRKILGKYFDLFSKIFSKIFLDFGQNTADFTRFWKNLEKKKICQNGNLGWSCL